MKFSYPQSIPCAFDNFPVSLDVHLGTLASSEVEGASLGSKFTLTRTPKCGMAQGAYVVGKELPECRMIYSDTGSDDDFTIKVSFIGYGSFYKYTDADEYIRFQAYKAIAIETALLGEKVFGEVFNCETLIPADADTTAIFDYDDSIVQYVEETESGEDEEGGYVYIDGQKIYIPAGASIDFVGTSSGIHTVSFVNNTVVIS